MREHRTRRIQHFRPAVLLRLQHFIIGYAGHYADTVDLTVASKSLNKMIGGFTERAVDQDVQQRNGEGR